jgi:hypothetical protein
VNAHPTTLTPRRRPSRPRRKAITSPASHPSGSVAKPALSSTCTYQRWAPGDVDTCHR